MLGLRIADDIAEDEFTLATRVAGVHQAGNVLALDQAGQQPEAVGGLVDRVEREARRRDWEIPR